MAQHQTEEARKIQILEAATHCVGRFGYHQTSVDTIAREAGLSKGAIYWYFKSKDDILIALSEWRGANNLFFLQRLADESKTFKRFLSKIQDATSQFFEHAGHEQRAIMELNAMAMDNAKLRSVMVKGGKQARTVMENLIIRCIKTGELKTGIKPKIAAMTLGSIIDGFTIQAMLERSPLVALSLRSAIASYYQSLKR